MQARPRKSEKVEELLRVSERQTVQQYQNLRSMMSRMKLSNVHSRRSWDQPIWAHK